ncbi:armadillo-type protein [Lipomyces kononenkoae]|uniref:Armadillo-type protein n=1 Tax=Lipomyces kononenkoae TaxID=34357 RepID=A0ACC3T6S9_LIPKO
MAQAPRSLSQFTPALPDELDLAKINALSADKQHVYIFTWLSDLFKYLESLDEDGSTSHQMFVKNELRKFNTFSSSILTRPIRNLVGRCYMEVYSKSDRKTLFDVINEVLNTLNTGKPDKNIDSKFFLVHVIGDIFSVAGDSIMAMAAHGILSLMRVLRYSGNAAGYRTSIFRSLGQIFSMAGSFVDENLARDVWKQARNGTSDKSSLVRAAALDCLREIFKNSSYFNNQSDSESLKTIVIKAFDSPHACVRKAAAVCWALSLSVASTATTSVIEVAPKKVKKPLPPNPDHPEEEGPSPAPQPTRKVIEHVTYTFEQALEQLAGAYTKPGVSARMRAGVVETYTEFLFLCGTGEIESQYLTIVKSLLDDVLSSPNIVNHRFKILTCRRHIQFLLNDVIGQQFLGENGRLTAVKILANEFLKNYPVVMKDQYEPSKYALAGAVGALKYLIEALGSAIIPLQRSIGEALLLVIQHPNYTVQIATSDCIRAFILYVPSQLAHITTTIMNNLNRELAVLKGRRLSADVAGRCIGYATALSVTIGVTNLRPQYASLDLTSRIFSLATSLLKGSGESDVLVSTTQIQVAWTLISGLMSLGPNFVKLHLSQLLLLWKSALPKPLSKDSVVEKNSLEYSFLLHVRECALSSIFAFLQFNKRLLTADVSKRLVVMLQNTTTFLNLILAKKVVEDPTMRLSSSLHLVDYEMMVRRRVFQCYIALIDAQHGDGLQADILTSAVSLFADPDNYTSPLSTTIASSSGSYESVWEVADNYAYGVCSFIHGFTTTKFGFEKMQGEEKEERSWLDTDSFTSRVEQMLQEPTLGALEHDFIHLLSQLATSSGLVPWQSYPKSPTTAVIDYAIELFILLLPLQTEKIQESILEQVASFLNSTSLQKDPGRSAAVTANVAVALSGTLKLITGEKNNHKHTLSDESVLKIISEMLWSITVQEDAYVRIIAADAIGRLSTVGGQEFTGIQVKHTVDEIVKNRDPNARAGLALALGSIHSHVGGMAAGFHLKTISSILMSLSNDPHPTVHFWAMKALSTTMESAGLTYASYAPSTIGMLCTLYLSETHDEECMSVLSSNLEVQYSTVRVLTHCIDGVIGVLGPDLQEQPKNRELISLLIQDIANEKNPFAVVEAIKCYQHGLLFAPQCFDARGFCQKIAQYINSPVKDLRDAAIDGYYQLARNDITSVFAYTGRALEGHIWLAYDMTPWHEGLRSIILTWLSQTCVTEGRLWVARCQAILVKLVARKRMRSSRSHSQDITPEPDLGDEEVASFAASEAGSGGGTGDLNAKTEGGEPLKWQTRVFALNCLKGILGKNKEDPDNLIAKLGDIVRAAFSASTSNVLEMRLVGIQLLDDILQTFGGTPDPDFPDSALLEQYQAQIAAALTPAFSSDSSPELAAEAIHVCADFIANGVVRDVPRMGRILKLLTNALDSCMTEGDEITLGDLKGISSNAQVMLKLATLSAWAELQVASIEQVYLKDVTMPHIKSLAPLWLSALKEFAQLKFEPDLGPGSGAMVPGPAVNTYSAGNKDSVVHFYEQSWLKIVEAIASVITQNPDIIIAVLDDRRGTVINGGHTEADDEPTAFFFVLFGVCFEALVKAPGGDVMASKDDMPTILNALKKILLPSICGNSVYQAAVFAEMIDLFDRTILTEDYNCQAPLIEIIKNLCINHPASNKTYDADLDGSDNINDGLNQMFELLRGVILILTQIYPAVADLPMDPKPITAEVTAITKLAMDAFKDMVESFPFSIRLDLYAIYLHIVNCLLDTPSSQATVIPALLPNLKAVLKNIVKASMESDSQSYGQILQGIRSFFALLITTLEQTSHAQHNDAVALRKNCLLCLVVVIGSCEHIMSANDSLIDDCATAIIESFNNPEVASVASQCVKSLLITSSRSSFTQMLGRKLLPQLVALATSEMMLTDDGDEMPRVVCDILVAFIKSLDGERVAPAMAVCIPVILHNTKEDEPETLSTQRRQLIEIAGVDPVSFKSVVAQISPAQHLQLDRLMRVRSTVNPRVHEDDMVSTPSIQLKTDFAF